LKLLILSILLIQFSFASSRDGANGSDGKNLTINAPSSFMEINLSGSNGDDGLRGYHGDNGSCSEDNNTAGRDGDRGGKGGNGGSGGILTVIYQNKELLKNILFISYGGSGGKGGPGGYGGDGCPNGSSGSSGDDGYSGSSGYLKIIPESLTPLKDQNIDSFQSVRTLINNGFQLNQQLWETQSPIQNILHARSWARNEYFELVGYFTRNAKFILRGNISESFALTRWVKFYKSNNQFLINQNQDLSIDYELVDNGSNAFYYIKHLVLKSDLMLSLDESNMIEKSQYLNFKFGPSIVDQPEFNIKMKIESKKFLKYHQVYNGIVPEQSIQLKENKVVVDLKSLVPDLKSKGKIRISYETESKLGQLKETKDAIWVINL
jgi:hypothetical protein